LHLRWLPPCPFPLVPDPCCTELSPRRWVCIHRQTTKTIWPTPDLHQLLGCAPREGKREERGGRWSEQAGRMAQGDGKDWGGGARLEHKIDEIKLSSLNARVVRFMMIWKLCTVVSFP
jgi:hypothetical protein